MLEWYDLSQNIEKPTKLTGKLPTVRTSVLRKASMQMFFITALTAASLSLCSFVIARAQIQRQMLSQLSSIAQNRTYLLEQRYQQDKERISLLGIDALSVELMRGRVSGSALDHRLIELNNERVPIVDVAVFNLQGESLYTYGDSSIAYIASSQSGPRMEMGGGSQVTYTIHIPLRTAENQIVGTVAVRYTLEDFLAVLYSSPGIGQTEGVVLGSLSEDEIILIMSNPVSGSHSFLEAGSFRDALKANIPIAGALAQSDGTIIGFDYSGERVLAAYAGIEELNWGLVVKVSHDEAMQGVFALAFTLIAISIILMLLAALVARIFARTLTDPITSLCHKMTALGPPDWEMKKTINTGDEVEVLEHVAADMAMRLKTVYEYMESEIADRTKELKQQYIRDTAILQAIDYGIVMTDAKGVVTNANPAALDFLACTHKTCTGKNVEEVLNIQIRHNKKLAKHPVIETLKTKKVVRSSPDVRYSIMRQDGILIPVLLSCVPLVDGKKVIGTVLVFQDETEQRRVDYLKSEFISLASHQLRTPLSSIQWYIELFNDEKKITKLQKEYLTEMEVASKRMTGLIDALLHAARLETGDITPVPGQVDVTQLLNELVEELRSMGKKKGIACKASLPNKSVTMHTDSILIHVVFKNLFSNAIKYTKKGGEVSVSLKDQKTHIAITVSDTGIGIPKKEQKRLFERLFRASNVLKMDTDGNGLGLYITKMIVDSLGGEVTVSSQEGKGTSVMLKLPKTMKKTK